MKNPGFDRLAFSCPTLLKRFSVAVALMVLTLPGLAQQVTVDITPGHSTNSFSPLRALGAGIDRDPLNSVHILFDPLTFRKCSLRDGGRSAIA